MTTTTQINSKRLDYLLALFGMSKEDLLSSLNKDRKRPFSIEDIYGDEIKIGYNEETGSYAFYVAPDGSVTMNGGGHTIDGYLTNNEFNDQKTIVSDTQPSQASNGQLWLNTATTPYELMVFNNGQWVYFSQQNGRTIYTSKPSKYSKGDLWILGPGEVCGNFTEGSMLEATQDSSSFDSSHWTDVMTEFTTLKTNISQYFEFNGTDGLKIGQKDENFSVKIKSDRIGFYDGDKEVVYIGNNSATIKNTIVEESAEFNCGTTFISR